MFTPAVVAPHSGGTLRPTGAEDIATMVKPRPPLDPDCADEVSQVDRLTSYDMEHFVTYLRVLDADADGADWTEVARIVLHIDPASNPARAHHAWESHLARARWMTEYGYRLLLSAANDP